MLAQEASIIDIIGVPFLLPNPSISVLVFEAVLAGAPHRACVQNGACKDAHDALTEGGLQNPPCAGVSLRKRAARKETHGARRHCAPARCCCAAGALAAAGVGLWAEPLK